ncbi:MAG TPA: hypothetical protein VGR13_01560 [Actinomycetota bacterium]|nr:hypothetical protein [Actinomycetota bacterium]
MDTETSTHPDLPSEQAYLDRACECLEDMRQQAARGARIVVAGDPYAEEAIYQMFLSRLRTCRRRRRCASAGSTGWTATCTTSGGGTSTTRTWIRW